MLLGSRGGDEPLEVELRSGKLLSETAQDKGTILFEPARSQPHIAIAITTKEKPVPSNTDEAGAPHLWQPDHQGNYSSRPRKAKKVSE